MKKIFVTFLCTQARAFSYVSRASARMSLAATHAIWAKKMQMSIEEPNIEACMQDDLTGDVNATPAPHGQRHWPWSGRVRHFIYIDFAIYLALLVMFCITTLTANTHRSFDSYHLVQSIQKTLLQEVCRNVLHEFSHDHHHASLSAQAYCTISCLSTPLLVMCDHLAL
jgi:hypothetical protein